MTDEQLKIIDSAKSFVTALFENEFSGHDCFHTLRVLSAAEKLAHEEGADVFTVSLAALLHDVDDRKLSSETYRNKERAAGFMQIEGVDRATADNVIAIIDEVSFKGSDSVIPASIEGKCVQDADRLDALGAIGIARTFAYGGSRGRKLYDPAIPPQVGMTGEQYYKSESTSLNHFYEKLFLLSSMMNTESAKKLAREREGFMKAFVAEFLAEWEGRN